MLNQATKDRDADREERKEFVKAIKAMASSSDHVASTNKDIANAVTKQAKESAERNGHLGELIVQQGEQTKQIADAAVKKIVSTVGVQNVKHQHVHDSVVEHEVVKDRKK